MPDDRDDNKPGGPGLGSILVLVVLLAGIAFAAYSTYRYYKFPRRWATQPEAKANLKSIYTAQRAYLQELDTYDTRARTIGFTPERGNRYAYFLAERGPVEYRDQEQPTPVDDAVIVSADRHAFPKATRFASFAQTKCPITPCTLPTGAVLATPGVDPLKTDVGSTGGFLAAAAGNLDDDPDLDCWSVCSEPRTTADGRTIPGGEPYAETNDFD